MCWLILYSVLEKANTSVTGGDSIKGRVVELRSLPLFFFFFTTVADTRKGANKALHPLATFTIEGKAGGERQAFYNWNECEWQLLSSCRHSSCLQPRRKIGTGMYPSVLCDRAVCTGYNTQPDFYGNSRANLGRYLFRRSGSSGLNEVLGGYWEGFRRYNFHFLLLLLLLLLSVQLNFSQKPIIIIPTMHSTVWFASLVLLPLTSGRNAVTLCRWPTSDDLKTVQYPYLPYLFDSTGNQPANFESSS